MSSATSPTVCFMNLSDFFLADSPEEDILETQFPPLRTKPPPPPISRVTALPPWGHVLSGGGGGRARRERGFGARGGPPSFLPRGSIVSRFECRPWAVVPHRGRPCAHR